MLLHVDADDCHERQIDGIHRFLFAPSVSVAWLVISVHPLWKYLSHTMAMAAMLLGVVCIAAGMHWLERLNGGQSQISAGWLVLLFLVLTVAFAVLYPISLRHDVNSGSDREDALRVGLNAIRHHEYPYDAVTYLGNPITPLPGALFLAAPFFALGHVSWQNILWLALFFLFTVRFFRHRATALFFLAVSLLFTPAILGDFVSGGDYSTNFFYLAIAIACFCWSHNRALYLCVPAALFLGVTLSSRVPYIVALIPLLALTLQRTSGFRTAGLFAVILIAAAAVTLPIFAPHPIMRLLEQFGQQSSKLDFLPSMLHAEYTLPLLAGGVACCAFVVRMDLPRLFLIFSAASFVMMGPPVVSLAFNGKNEFSYLAICVLPFVLWALSQFERGTDASILVERV
jgi:hypothetical protein